MIATLRLTLRTWRDTDTDAVIEMNRDPEVMRFVGEPLEPAASVRILDRFRHHFAEHGFSPWCIEYQARPIGWVGLSYPLFRSEPEIGWRLIREAWGHGFATEGARAALADVFERCDVTDVISFTTEQNLRSRAVMERLGMKHDIDGDFLHPSLPAEHPLAPHVLYRLRRDQFDIADQPSTRRTSGCR